MRVSGIAWSSRRTVNDRSIIASWSVAACAGSASRPAASSAPRILEISFMLSFLCRAHPERPHAG